MLNFLLDPLESCLEKLSLSEESHSAKDEASFVGIRQLPVIQPVVSLVFVFVGSLARPGKDRSTHQDTIGVPIYYG
jgi:hypothetical protein